MGFGFMILLDTKKCKFINIGCHKTIDLYNVTFQETGISVNEIKNL